MEQFIVNTRSGTRIDKVPNRLLKFWFYLNKQQSNKDAFIIISREKICQDLQIKDATLADYVSGTFNFRHMWQIEGGFQNFSTIYGGNIMVIFYGLREDNDGNLHPKHDRLRGSILEFIDKSKGAINDTDESIEPEDLD